MMEPCPLPGAGRDHHAYGGLSKASEEERDPGTGSCRSCGALASHPSSPTRACHCCCVGTNSVVSASGAPRRGRAGNGPWWEAVALTFQSGSACCPPGAPGWELAHQKQQRRCSCDTTIKHGEAGGVFFTGPPSVLSQT